LQVTHRVRAANLACGTYGTYKTYALYLRKIVSIGHSIVGSKSFLIFGYTPDRTSLHRFKLVSTLALRFFRKTKRVSYGGLRGYGSTNHFPSRYVLPGAVSVGESWESL